MTNEEMLKLVQKDRPYQKIKEVIGFEEIENSSYKVTVIMELNHVDDDQTIIYPLFQSGTNVLNLPHYK